VRYESVLQVQDDETRTKVELQAVQVVASEQVEQ
jgi:hypothetical protein